MSRLIAAVIAIIVLLAGYLAWSHLETSSGTSGDAVVTVETSGGFCAPPGCQPHTYRITEAGVSTDGGMPRAISAAEYQALAQQVADVAESDFPAKEGGRLCPSAYDAIDVKYTFASGTKTVRADNCEEEVSPEHPLISLVHKLIYPDTE
jgi:hypothetical protein